MSSQTEFEDQNRGKEDFHAIYNRADPYKYYGTLAKLEYSIAGAAKPVLREVVEELKETRHQDKIKILDLGCSYGVNSALLKYDLELDELYDYYDGRGELPASSAVAQDSEFFEGQEPAGDLEIVGLDIAEEAVRYACATGLLDQGIVANLETEELTSPTVEKVADVDIVISTGCVGYVTDTTFSHLITKAADAPPWVASFVLRMFPYDSIAQTLGAAGLATEKLPGYLFPQRDFATDQERQHVADVLESLELNPSRELADDRYYAEFFLSRRPDEMRERSLEAFLDGHGSIETEAPEDGIVPCVG